MPRHRVSPFGELDDRLQRGILCAVTVEMNFGGFDC